MPEVVTKKLGTYIGAEVLDVDRDRLLADDDLPQACLDALEGVACCWPPHRIRCCGTPGRSGKW